MKKLMFLIASLILCIGSAYAQKGQMAAGVNLNYGTDISTIGLGGKFQYGITDEIRGEAAFNHSFTKDFTKMWDFEVTGHYLFPLSEKVTVYPLAGFCFTKVIANVGNLSASESNFGVNLGGGIEYPIIEALSVGLEAKYQFVSNLDQAIFNLGFTYKF
jgi:outer membrane protein X